MWKHTLIFSILSLTSLAHAQETAAPVPSPTPFMGESELGSTITSGNSKTNNLAAKTLNKYTEGSNLWTLSGRYLRNTEKEVETALSWDVGLRYDRSVSEDFSLFIGHKVEADGYAGYVQRDSSDLGVKESFLKSDVFYWLGEAGYRYTKTHIQNSDTYESFGRLYTEAQRALSKTSYVKLWLEYLPNFTTKERYLTNGEASLSVSISEVLSLKVGYLVKYQNQPLPGIEKTDTVFVTTLVAKY